MDYTRSGTKRTCIKARELIIALPENFIDYDKHLLLQTVVDFYKKEYGVECYAGLHHNKSMSNFYIHLTFAERKLLSEPMEKIATRTMVFNEKGKHVRTKNKILIEDGDIRKGCKVIPKGEVYEHQIFAPKIKYFKNSVYLNEVKHKLTNFINQYVNKKDKKLFVFDKSGPYLPTKRLERKIPKQSRLRRIMK